MRMHSHILGREVEFDVADDGSATVEGIAYSRRDLALLKRREPHQRAAHHNLKLFEKAGFDPEEVADDPAVAG